MRKRILALGAGLLLFLTGCAANMPSEKAGTGERLPEVREGPAAPTGDSQAERESSVVIYLPDIDASRLTAQAETIVIQPGQTKQEATVEALLAFVNGSDFYTGSQPLRLALVSSAVESTGELVTVNLHNSAHALGPEQFFALKVAITNTLTELPGINYVNVLINGRDSGLDLAGTVPTGVLTRYPSGDISTFWGQMQGQIGAESSELQRVAALYFVSEDGESLLAELRNVTFSIRDPAAYAKALLDEMTITTQARAHRVVTPTTEWFERDPVYVAVENAPGVVELYFTRYVDDYLQLYGATRAMLMSSITMTLTSFIPQISGIRVYVDGEGVSDMALMDGMEWTEETGLMTRDAFAALTADTATVYFPLADGSGVSAVTRPIAQRLRTQPRALLRELMKAPGGTTLTRALPETVDDADILGIKIQDDTALVNLSEAFAEACRNLTATEERNMVYAIVNTLTEIDGVTRVRFYVAGEEAALAGHLFMQGEFMRHTGIIR